MVVQSNDPKQPAPEVLHPFRYVSQSESDVAVVLSVQTIFLQTELDQMHFYPSVVEDLPQAEA